MRKNKNMGKIVISLLVWAVSGILLFGSAYIFYGKITHNMIVSMIMYTYFTYFIIYKIYEENIKK